MGTISGVRETEEYITFNCSPVRLKGLFRKENPEHDVEFLPSPLLRVPRQSPRTFFDYPYKVVRFES